jgi:hypothetical protein
VRMNSQTPKYFRCLMYIAAIAHCPCKINTIGW